MSSRMPKRRLEQLPVEIIHDILARLPDIQSLAAAVLTGPNLYQAFLHAPSRITKEVLLRQIPTELLHDALAAEVSSHRDIWTHEQADDFLAKYLACDQQPFAMDIVSSSVASPILLPCRILHSLAGVFYPGSTPVCTAAVTVRKVSY